MNIKIPFLNLQITRAPAGAIRGRRNTGFFNLFSDYFGIPILAHDQDYASLLRAYRGWVYTCASLNSTSFASVPLKLYTTKQSQKKLNFPTKAISSSQRLHILGRKNIAALPQVLKANEIVEVTDHPYLELMKNINPFMNNFFLFELTELYQELCGNAYWYILKDRLGTPAEIWPLPPANIKIIPDPNTFIRAYQYQFRTIEKNFEVNDVIHFKFPNPNSLYYGYSPLAAVAQSYNIQERMGAYENFLFKNMGRPEGAFETDNELDDIEFARLKEEIQQLLGGVENVGKATLFEKGVTFKNYGLSPRDMSYTKGRKVIQEEISLAYGQPLGLFDKSATKANAYAAEYRYQKTTLKPRLLRAEQKLNEQLMPLYDPSLFCVFDENVPQDKDARLKEIEIHLKTQYSSVNQEREVDNLDPVPWGDVPQPQTSNIAPDQSEGKFVTPETIAEFSEAVAEMVLDRLV